LVFGIKTKLLQSAASNQQTGAIGYVELLRMCSFKYKCLKSYQRPSWSNQA
jgi:hypothetical protein